MDNYKDNKTKDTNELTFISCEYWYDHTDEKYKININTHVM